MLLLADVVFRLRGLRGPGMGFGHARIWLLLVVLVVILITAWVNNRNRRR
jgi:hypothetical protein